uniref:Uncharacterized protein n=1 Tax=Arundo donax TaxID=35708 RepID=A0A0A9GR56_ARUDO
MLTEAIFKGSPMIKLRRYGTVK